ncbi:MAG: VCBS repeat-containing protein, partial [Saprospiraceae bacterium]
KTSLGEDELGVFRFKLYYGYNHQFARNNLQLNNGDGTFSEIGMFAGVHATDWSWAPLFMDFDDDGYKDLFISNGIPRRMNDIDYVNFRANNDLRWKASSNNLEESDLRFEDKMPQIKLPNKFYLNNGHLQFTDISNQVTNDENTFSNGAIYADLDNDGDLDVVVNNQEDEPFVYQNTKVEKGLAAGSHLTLSLKGPPANINAIGARVFVFKGPQEIVYEHYPVRGFQSSVLSSLHIGVGDTTTIDSIIVIWPDNSWQRLENPVFNSTAEVAWRPGLPSYSFDRMGYPSPHRFNFSDITARTGLDFTHHENPFVEFDREFLIPHMVSTEGPAVAVGDLNGDGLDDVFFGGAKRHRSAVYFQQPNGRFTPGPPEVFRRDSLFEDVDAVLAWISWWPQAAMNSATRWSR